VRGVAARSAPRRRRLGAGRGSADPKKKKTLRVMVYLRDSVAVCIVTARSTLSLLFQVYGYASFQRSQAIFIGVNKETFPSLFFPAISVPLWRVPERLRIFRQDEFEPNISFNGLPVLPASSAAGLPSRVHSAARNAFASPFVVLELELHAEQAPGCPGHGGFTELAPGHLPRALEARDIQLPSLTSPFSAAEDFFQCRRPGSRGGAAALPLPARGTSTL